MCREQGARNLVHRPALLSVFLNFLALTQEISATILAYTITSFLQSVIHPRQANFRKRNGIISCIFIFFILSFFLVSYSRLSSSLCFTSIGSLYIFLSIIFSFGITFLSCCAPFHFLSILHSVSYSLVFYVFSLSLFFILFLFCSSIPSLPSNLSGKAFLVMTCHICVVTCDLRLH